MLACDYVFLAKSRLKTSSGLLDGMQRKMQKENLKGKHLKTP